MNVLNVITHLCDKNEYCYHYSCQNNNDCLYILHICVYLYTYASVCLLNKRKVIQTSY